MEEISPLGVTLGLATSLCENPGISRQLEITRLNLVGQTATLLGGSELIPLHTSSDVSLPVSVEIEDSENSKTLPDERIIRSSISTNECPNGLSLEDSLVSMPLVKDNGPTTKVGIAKSVFELDCVPLWGSVSICGHRLEMEDAVMVKPNFMRIPIKMFADEMGINGISWTLSHLRSHFFGVYDGHGGSQVADYCRDRLHGALAEELKNHENETANGMKNTRQAQWEEVFKSCFLKVDEEIVGDGINDPIAPQTVGSTAVVAVVCSSHIIVANCGDSRAVLYRGKEAIPLSVDHKPTREDEYDRIVGCGGMIMQWNGLRVLGVLAMSRSIGDKYMKPWIIPDPEVMLVPRAKEDECLVLATDGLWDVMSNEEACQVARKRILIWHKKNGTNPLQNRGQGVDPAAQDAAEYLCNLALQEGTRDNISVIVVDLKSRRKFKTKP
ncbi:protein phosphatase 2c [Striga asiatica]|uniref:protein-serine/threonine phosphatase n=1 Tax=Striga asiatica TaxID=4170 RepID=A0A5A7QJ81_STRAF|nr:protein phosphatase 2c [Striga asiatica]